MEPRCNQTNVITIILLCFNKKKTFIVKSKPGEVLVKWTVSDLIHSTHT